MEQFRCPTRRNNLVPINGAQKGISRNMGSQRVIVGGVLVVVAEQLHGVARVVVAEAAFGVAVVPAHRIRQPRLQPLLPIPQRPPLSPPTNLTDDVRIPLRMCFFLLIFEFYDRFEMHSVALQIAELFFFRIVLFIAVAFVRFVDFGD